MARASILSAYSPAPPVPGLLRQADWRFLLPAARHGVFERLIVHGGSSDLSATIRELGIAADVLSDSGEQVAGDAVIALAGAMVSPEHLAANVAQGGVLYCEVDRRLPWNLALTPARIAQHLTSAGLTPVATYWVKPGFPQRQMYLPVASPAAFRWYLNTLYGTHARHRRIMKRLVGAVAGHRRLATFAPCYAITAVRGALRAPALVEVAGATQAWHEGKAHPVLLANAAAEWSRVAMLLFGDEEPVGPTIFKWPRTSTFNPEVEWEHDVLHMLRARLSPPLRASVPVSRLTEWNGLTVAVESCMAGAALSSRAARTTIETLDDMRLVATWLASLHQETTVDRVASREWLTRHLTNGLCRQYAETFGVSEAESHLFEVVGRAVATCYPGSLPLAWQHTDLGPWNVYRDGNQIRVIDWEVARRGPVLSDLLYFAAQWGATVKMLTTASDRIEYGVALLGTRMAADPVSRGIREEIAGYMHRVGLHWSHYPFLLVYTFLEQALDLSRRRSTVGADPSDRDGNAYVAYVDALARHADALFGKEAHGR